MANSLNRLLDRDFAPEYRQEVTEHVAAEPGAAAGKTRSVVIFRVHAEWLALSTSVFQGVAPIVPAHTLPHRRDGALLGLTHVQGTLLVCVSLAELLGIQAQSAPTTFGRRGGRLMIVNGHGGPVAIPVQEVHGVHRYRPNELHDIPATLAHSVTRYTMGMLPWNDRWVARLDDDFILHAMSKVLS